MHQGNDTHTNACLFAHHVEVERVHTSMMCGVVVRSDKSYADSVKPCCVEELPYPGIAAPEDAENEHNTCTYDRNTRVRVGRVVVGIHYAICAELILHSSLIPRLAHHIRNEVGL